MKRKVLSIGVLLLTGGIAYSQVGINTEDPKATLDVMSTNTGAATAEGFIAPRLTRTQIISKDTQYALPQTGTIVYITDLSGSTTTKTAKIIQIGYYYFDGTLWQPFTSAAAASSNPWNKVGTALPSTLNTDDSYLTAKTVIGGNTIASVNGGTANAQLTVTGGDASINGVTVGKGRSAIASNTAVGANSLVANTTGSTNTAVGGNSLQLNTTGLGNTALGYGSLSSITTSTGSTAVGIYALQYATGTNNTAVGSSAGSGITGGTVTGSNNTMIGSSSGVNITTGSYNITLGQGTSVPSPAGDSQINIGNTIYGISNGANNAPGRVSIGKTAPATGVYLDVAGLTQITGANTFRYVDGNQAAGKVLVSDAAGNAVWTLSNTLPVANPWYQVGTTSPSTLNTQNSYLTAQAVIGGNARASINGGLANAQLTVTGDDASINGITVGKGRSAGVTNTTLAVNGLAANTTGSLLTAVGYGSLAANTTGVDNTAIGASALAVTTVGTHNTAIGAQALRNIIGSRNIGVGAAAGGGSTGTPSGNDNIFIGYQSGISLTTGSSNLMIGNSINVPTATGSNQMNIANTIYGTTSATAAGGRISIGKTAPATGVYLDVAGLTQITGANTFRYVDGNQAAGRLLTSDANGNASWTQPNVLKSPLFPASSGTAYNGPLASNINSGISITLPANSTWIVHLEQLIRFNRSLKTYQSGANILSEGIWLRFNWSDTPTGAGSGDISAGKLISVACYPGPNYHLLIGDTVLRNTSASSKTYYLTTSTVDSFSIDASSPITFSGLFSGWSENTLFALPGNN